MSHHAELAVRRPLVGLDQGADHGSGVRALRQQVQPGRTVGEVHIGLVARAPAPGRAAGTNAPTARNLEATATPHVAASGVAYHDREGHSRTVDRVVLVGSVPGSGCRVAQKAGGQ
jgi:hypothetical protein